MGETNCLEQKPMTLVKKTKEALVAMKPVQHMDDLEAAKLADIYAARYGQWVDAQGKAAQRLVAAFLVKKGRILRLQPFDSVKSFSLTERRKQLIERHYGSCSQSYVIMYMQGDTEFYHQISLRDFAAWPDLEARVPKSPMEILLELWHGPKGRRRGH